MASSRAAKVTRICLIGSNGRLGLAIAEVAKSDFAKTARLTSQLDRGIGGTLAASLSKADVILDVSAPDAAVGYLGELLRGKAKPAYVIGCTGWTDKQLETVRSYAKRASVVLAPNFSPGVNLFLGLLAQAAPLLKKWGYDAAVHDLHHTRKRDAPSGTAKAIVEALGDLKPQVHSTRAGNLVGTHEVRFVGPGDVITLEHEALDRAIFARGAIMAAQWAQQQSKPGLYSMKEVIFGSD